MTDQIERVARAICKALGCNPDGMTQHFESVDGAVMRDEAVSHWQRCIPSARAAMEEMREPTADMIESGLREGNLKGTLWDLQLRAAYQAMIDAALGK